jgi:hypothetical protein
MTTPLNITSLQQGKLHANHEALWVEVTAQHVSFEKIVNFVMKALAQGAKMLSWSHADSRTDYKRSAFNSAIHRT